MPLAVVASRALAGIDAPEVTVEVHIGPGLPAFHIVGLPDTEVREAKDRVRAALEHVRLPQHAPESLWAAVSEAVELVEKKQNRDGQWPLQNPHHDPVNFLMEGPAGAPSRWNTLRALRVLNWYAAGV